ncbi:AbrB family transcriptional regulator [bacterium (Candidatus Howlettbacteria) CG_4_10_14_0_8_um_filter_40_9]|nr:MAG: AbrB family transcriptional regulator [bacterium (Candidatus Howlettbacteria) CG_4_10_14_0_8_um_filter_40_9]
MEPIGHGKCYGTTSVGERGQIVIPKEARDEMKLRAGDKLVVCGKHDKALILIKADELPQFLDGMIGKLTEMKEKLNRKTDTAK